ncbi:NUDIX hydrolase [Roseibium algae]|uniref:NUDIX hydrolase n=1 Tax=Roseibium algae TaxID=3123038 RepID=A0ABU8TLP7_9HYPH
MSSIDSSWAVTKPLFRDLKSLFRRPARLQIGALCYRVREGDVEVLLVTSRSSRRWILPKGWPILKRRAHKTASIEAYEEAGIVGNVSKKPFGTFNSYKGHAGGLKIRTQVMIFLIQVTDTLDDYPEVGQRELRWLAIDDAIKLADEQGLSRLLSKFNAEMANYFSSQ